MKLIRTIAFASLLLLLLSIPTGVLAQDPAQPPGNTFTGDQVVIANTYRLESGDTLNGNLLVIGGTATIASGATMAGDVVLIGGTINIEGNVDGEILAIGGAVNLKEAAVVNGDLVMVGANLNRSSLARINGKVTEQVPGFLEFQPSNPEIPLDGNIEHNTLKEMLNVSYQSLALAVLAGLIALLLPSQLKRVVETVKEEPVVSGAIGLLAAILIPILLVVLTITILLIPVMVLCAILFGLAVLLGFISAGYLAGERLATFLKTNWPPAIVAGIGTLVVSLVVGFIGLIPCVGWVIGFLVMIVGLGAVGITLFGSASRPGLIRRTPAARHEQPIQPDLPEAINNENEKESK